jgi:hypothetical protein
MKRAKRTGAWAWTLAAAMAMLAIGTRTSRAEVTVTETPSRVTVENQSVQLVFDPAVNYVPAELAYKRGSGQNLIVNNFCLYYQYIENGAIRSVNEGETGDVLDIPKARTHLEECRKEFFRVLTNPGLFRR